MENEGVAKANIIYMDKIRNIIKRKPLLFIITSAAYVTVVSLLKWGIHPTLDSAWFMIGGFIGIYFLDVAEDFFALHSSPFRSVLFMGVYAIVSFFITTSSSIALARGLVLSLYLQLLLWQVGEWRLTGSDASWYKLVADAVPKRTQEWLLFGFIVLFIVETYLFIR